MVATTESTSKTPQRTGLTQGCEQDGHEQALDARALIAPPGSRRGVRAHASDWLSRMERRTAYLPV
jgi:hypothetical protein